MNENLDAQEDELLALESIFGPEVFVRAADGTRAAAAGELRVSVELPQDFFVAVKDGDAFVYYGVSSLPTLTLRFELPEGYPSSSPPTFTLSCSWLTEAQVFALDAQLAALYQATGGAVVLFSWVQFLKEVTLSILNVNSLLVLPYNVNSPPCSEDVTSPAPNPGSDRADRAAAPRDIRDSEGAAGLAPALKDLIDNLPDEEEPSDGGGTTARTVNSPDDDDDDDDDVDDDDTAPLSSESTDGVPALNQSTSKPDGSSRGVAAHLPEACGRPCSSSSSTPPAPPAAPAPPPRAPSSSQTLLSVILLHDAAQRQRRFAESVRDCGVCLAPVLGAKCMQLRDCEHVHCEPCLAQYCTGLIAEGNVRGVTCPHPRCKATPTPAQVRRLVGDDLFYRYERLLFQTTLDSMTDVVYCPRVFCASAVIVEPGSDVAQCSVCSFAFCVACRQSYHGRGPCRAAGPPRRTANEERDYADIPQSLEGMMALWEDYCSGSAQRKKLLEQRYGTRVLNTSMSNYLNEGWYVNNETKNCPYCKATIQKNGGCDHMHCAVCERHFLWENLPNNKYVP
ncbi:E3 ubiquitin-protein ligase RNF14-like [Gadus chalcogrammus]|uniref:E3 ubiquitin-protein ligase RNF14-like n=1 Tax=Gadus chalcogrammus TaxID=1042646 RepID=UPI0024C47B8D|nr:E3 ubiquitin-protein ligase RNF14-like [Gadus chalcogrammus]